MWQLNWFLVRQSTIQKTNVMRKERPEVPCNNLHQSVRVFSWRLYEFLKHWYSYCTLNYHQFYTACALPHILHIVIYSLLKNFVLHDRLTSHHLSVLLFFLWLIFIGIFYHFCACKALILSCCFSVLPCIFYYLFNKWDLFNFMSKLIVREPVQPGESRHNATSWCDHSSWRQGLFVNDGGSQ